MADDDRTNLLLQTLAQAAISVELEPTLQILADSLPKLVTFDAGGIFVLDAAQKRVRARVTRGYPDDLDIPTARGIVGEVLRTGQSRLVRNVKDEPAYVAVRPSTASQLTVPLASARGVLGAVSLEADRLSAFDDQDRASTVKSRSRAKSSKVSCRPWRPPFRAFRSPDAR